MFDSRQAVFQEPDDSPVAACAHSGDEDDTTPSFLGRRIHHQWTSDEGNKWYKGTRLFNYEFNAVQPLMKVYPTMMS